MISPIGQEAHGRVDWEVWFLWAVFLLVPVAYILRMQIEIKAANEEVSVHVPQRDRDRYVDGRSTSRNVIATGTVDGHVDGGSTSRNVIATGMWTGTTWTRPVCGRGVYVPQRDRDRYVGGYNVDATGMWTGGLRPTT